jgi:hypothetical protein
MHRGLFGGAEAWDRGRCDEHEQAEAEEDRSDVHQILYHGVMRYLSLSRLAV